MQQALSQPRYDAEVFRRTRQQAELALRQNESQPGYIAMRESVKLDYPQHSYSAAAYTSVQSLQAVSLDDVKTFHRNQYAKEGAVVALVGDSTASKLIAWWAICSKACLKSANRRQSAAGERAGRPPRRYSVCQRTGASGDEYAFNQPQRSRLLCAGGG